MRVSCIENDPGFETFWKLGGHRCFGQNYAVFLDGKEFSNCFTADEEKGEAMTYATDENGRLIVDGEELREITLRGKVEIRPKAGVRTDLPTQTESERPIKRAVVPGAQ